MKLVNVTLISDL